MPTYKLSYFNFTGLGEPARFILSYAGIDFEDNRISVEDWPQYKPQMPMEKVPVLEIDGKKYHQSLSICRYIAKKCNAYGSNDLEALEIDAAVDSIDDLRNELATFFWCDEPEWKEKLKTNAMSRLEYYLDKFETILKANNGYFVGNKLTWADIFFASLKAYLSNMAERDITANHPNLAKLVNEVYGLPNIKAYLEKAPKTKF